MKSLNASQILKISHDTCIGLAVKGKKKIMEKFCKDFLFQHLGKREASIRNWMKKN